MQPLEIDAAPAFLPITETGGLGTGTAADFGCDRRAGHSRCGCDVGNLVRAWRRLQTRVCDGRSN